MSIPKPRSGDHDNDHGSGGMFGPGGSHAPGTEGCGVKFVSVALLWPVLLCIGLVRMARR